MDPSPTKTLYTNPKKGTAPRGVGTDTATFYDSFRSTRTARRPLSAYDNTVVRTRSHTWTYSDTRFYGEVLTRHYITPSYP